MIIRLQKDYPEHWGLYPKLEGRMREFNAKYGLTCPLDMVFYEMQQRWLLYPNLAGYFLAFDGDEIKGHFTSWINSLYNQNILYIYQAASEMGANQVLEIWPTVQSWIKSLNDATSDESKWVKKAEYWTWNDPKSMIKLFKMGGVSSIQSRSVIECDIFPSDKVG